jgi:hypothetical protein
LNSHFVTLADRLIPQAMAQAHQYIAEGYGWCVDLDLEELFDQVDHDKPTGRSPNGLRTNGC